MDDAIEHGLVILALRCNQSNCVQWKDAKTEERVRNDPELAGLTPLGIKRILREFARDDGEIKQKDEGREWHRDDYDRVYMARIPVEGLLRPLFVEFVLSDADPDVPVVTIVNAHLHWG